MNKNLLIIFAKSPVKGNVKTRLAKAVGEDKALAVYQKLLAHTLQITDSLTTCDKAVYYAEATVQQEHRWPQKTYQQHHQQGQDLGERMCRAIQAGFDAGYKRVVLIGTDCPELTSEHIRVAFNGLQQAVVVIGPAADGGYYLVGTSEPVKEIFFNKSWSSSRLLDETLHTLKDLGIAPFMLPVLSDIDEVQDMERFPAFRADASTSISG